jgi:signal peptidase I
VSIFENKRRAGSKRGRPPAGSARSLSSSWSGKSSRPGAPAVSPSPEKPGKPAEPETQTAKKRSKSTLGSIVELVAIVLVALGVALAIQAWVVKPYRIPSGSMEPTLDVGQRIVANRIGMSISGPHAGEIVVFHPPQGASENETSERPICEVTGLPVKAGGPACAEPVPHEASVNFIKRVVAGPGDELYIKEGHAYRNGVREKDPYIKPCEPSSSPECNFPVPIKIPPGHWFMMGDNRGESDDSRFWGPVPTGWIVGDAVATYWPPDRIGFF